MQLFEPGDGRGGPGFAGGGAVMLWPSLWALALAPLGVTALRWGAVLPEERYLSAKFEIEYDAYRAPVRRWL